MDEDAESGSGTGGQLRLLLEVLQEEAQEFSSYSSEFDAIAQEQTERLTRDLAPR